MLFEEPLQNISNNCACWKWSDLSGLVLIQMASDPLSAAYTWSQIWGCSFHKPAIMLRHKSRWPPKPCLEFASYKHHEDILSVIFLRHYFAMAWPLGINRNKRADLNRHIKSNMLQLIQIVFVDGDWIIVCYPSNLLKKDLCTCQQKPERKV